MPHSYLRTIALLIAIAGLLLGAASAAAQQPGRVESASGTLYVIGFPDTTKNTFDSRHPNSAYVDKAIVLMYSAVDTKVTIKGRDYNRSFTITGGTFKSVEMMGDSATSASAPIIVEHCKPVDNTLRLESDAPIVVYQYLVTKFGTEAWTPLPVDTWGRDYYAAAMPGEIGSDVSPGGEFDYNRKNKMFPAEILVIAAYDDTRITIVPTGQILNFCRAENIVLKAGEAYQVQSYVDTLTANLGGDQPDFGGSRIFSTKPVGVISGNTRAQLIDENIGLGKNIFKNMLIEWLAPVEQHGTEFVYMPTWDARRPTGAPGEDPAEKRKAEFVRIYSTTSEDPTTSTYTDSLGQVIPTGEAKPIGGFTQTRLRPTVASVFRSDRPAQAMMSVPAVVRYAGTTQGGSYIGAAYEGWGGYMVELTPREQWVSFAPFHASSFPGSMEHFINVVTDTSHMNDVFLKNGAPFIFQRRIAGSDLIWGSMALTPGVDNWLEGRNGAKFAGFVYGGLAKGGREQYTPGRSRGQDENPPGLANGGASGDGVRMLHPSEYEEYLAIAYGYPLAPARRVAGAGDSLSIRTTESCNGTCYDIEAVNNDPVGISSLRLELPINAKIRSINPYPLTNAVRATVCVTWINPELNASATLYIRDLTGKVTRVPFTYYVDTVSVDRTELDFGIVSPGTTRTMEITITNPMSRAIVLRSGVFLHRSPALSIQRPSTFPVTIAPQGTYKVVVEARPPQPDRSYRDTLSLLLGCTTVSIPLFVETSEPCVVARDLDFGAIAPGATRTLTLRISNEGGGVVTFDNPSGGDVLEWTGSMFEVSASDLARLKAAALARGEFVDITVAFRAAEQGDFRVVARVWASTRSCRDTSVWTARIDQSLAAPLETTLATSLEASQPNPTSGITEIRFTLAERSQTTLVVYDARGERIATLVDGELDAGAHTVRFDASRMPAGIYHYRLDADGLSQTRSFVRE
jgi:hypothetical protein